MTTIESKCKICRRAGEKLFLKGERCFTPKCAMVHHPTPPGIHGNKKKGGRRASSEYGSELREKQKVRFMYGLSEGMLENYIAKAQKQKKGILTDTIVEFLERRLDNAVFRAGLAVSRSVARHMVTYGHIWVNGKSVSIPSYRVSNNDTISIRPESISSPLFRDIDERLKTYQPPAWITLDTSAKTAKITGMPTQDNVQFSHDLRKIIQFYSR